MNVSLTHPNVAGVMRVFTTKAAPHHVYLDDPREPADAPLEWLGGEKRAKAFVARQLHQGWTVQS